MEVLLLLIPLSVALAAGFTVACLRAIRKGQFDDLESPKWRMLFDSPAAPGAALAGPKTANDPLTDNENRPHNPRSEPA